MWHRGAMICSAAEMPRKRKRRSPVDETRPAQSATVAIAAAAALLWVGRRGGGGNSGPKGLTGNAGWLARRSLY